MNASLSVEKGVQLRNNNQMTAEMEKKQTAEYSCGPYMILFYDFKILKSPFLAMICVFIDSLVSYHIKQGIT